MTLYKNVDLEDLKSIMKKGILPISKTGNNWGAGKRAPNSTEVVYLFSATGEYNSFPQYGLALLEVEVDANENEFFEGDVNEGKYSEYTTTEVNPEQIKNIYIPSMYENREDLEQFISGLNVTFVDIEGTVTVGTETVEITEEMKTMFGQRTSVNTADYNFLFCWDDNKKMNSIENVNYKF